MIDDDKFFAWLDGELGPDEAARVAAEVERDAELSRKAREHRALMAELHRAFDPVAEAPVPEVILAAANVPADNIVDLTARRERRRSRLAGGAPKWAGMAAALALGIALGTMLDSGAITPVELKGGNLYAASAVGEALDGQLAEAAAGDVRIGLSFRDRAGGICRTFAIPSSSGLACRDDGRWKVQGLFAAPEGQGTDYRMAAGADARLMALVDERIAGDPFDAEQERAARARGWR